MKKSSFIPFFSIHIMLDNQSTPIGSTLAAKQAVAAKIADWTISN